jgi:hypothetical protein
VQGVRAVARVADDLEPRYPLDVLHERLSGGLLVLDDQHLEHGGHVPSPVGAARLTAAEPLLDIIAHDEWG